jgi:hypothetical protein
VAYLLWQYWEVESATAANSVTFLFSERTSHFILQPTFVQQPLFWSDLPTCNFRELDLLV